MYIMHADASAENVSKVLNSSLHFAYNMVFTSRRQTSRVDAAHGRFDGTLKSITLYGTPSEYSCIYSVVAIMNAVFGSHPCRSILSNILVDVTFEQMRE